MTAALLVTPAPFVVRSRARWSGRVVAAVGAIGFPFVMSDRWQSIGVFALIAAIGALGLHVLTGLGGQTSLGHASFLGAGAYAATWAQVDKGWAMWVWLPGAAVAGALGGLLVGGIAARVKGLYSAVVSVALVVVTSYLWRVWTPVSGGFNGRSAVVATINGTDLLDGVTVFGVRLEDAQVFWFVALAILVVLATAVSNVQRGRIGRALAAVRDRDTAAAVVGVPVARIKLLAWMLAGGLGAVAGALLAAFQSYVVPSQWGFALSIEYVAIIVVGGLGTVVGTLAGAAFVVSLPPLVTTLSRFLPFIDETASTSGGLSVELVSSFIYGLAIVIVLVFEPGGLVGARRHIASLVRRRQPGGTR